MPVRYVAAGVIGLFMMLGWNVFLAHRDTELFRAIEAPGAEVRK